MVLMVDDGLMNIGDALSPLLPTPFDSGGRAIDPEW